MLLARYLILAATLVTVACRGPDSSTNQARPQGEATIAPILTTPDAKDDASYARPLEARVRNVALDLASLDVGARA